ncbi:transposase [Corallococcus macrosporus]|uniref:Transposase n=1 Tax=Corallococcus macrosporus TaxID=35 RepID=A0ABS3DK86_9BACT|nr:transposase [Corallococcus macrosporus]
MHAEGDAFIVDTGYDADRIRAKVLNLGMRPVIHPSPSRTCPQPLDRNLNRMRYRVECVFDDLKRFRAVATRYDNTATSYPAVLYVTFMVLCLR